MSDYYLNIGNLPGGFCPANYQELFNVLSTIGFVSLGSGTSATVVISATKPSDTTVVWKRIDSLGRYLGDYIYGQGAWLRAHSLQPGSTIWWFNTLPDFTTFDGGDGNTLGLQSGAMWQLAKDLNGNVIAAQFPIAAGTLPSTTVLANGDTGGEENHVLTGTESAVDPNHRHAFGKSRGVGDSCQFAVEVGGTLTVQQGLQMSPNTGSNNVNVPDISALAAPINTVLQTDTPSQPTSVAGHNTMPPYIVGYLLQRTTRQFYAVT